MKRKKDELFDRDRAPQSRISHPRSYEGRAGSFLARHLRFVKWRCGLLWLPRPDNEAETRVKTEDYPWESELATRTW